MAPAAATAPAPAQATVAPTVVRRIGRYELRRLVGKSTGSMTWLAVHGSTGDEWLLTLPRVQPADAAALAAWRHAAEFAARVDHPHLAPVDEIGVHERWPYVAVSRRHGQTLAERCAADPHVPPIDAATWIAAVLRGLAAAHEARCSHGDLQAEHVLLGDDGSVRVMALAVASHPVDAPVSGSPVASSDGADPYGALHRQRLDAERDVLAVALLLHRLLAGRLPLELADTSLAIAQLPPHGRAVLRLPWTSLPQVPDALRAIADRGTASRPRERYLAARPFLRALEGWLESDRHAGGGPIALLLGRLQSVGHLPAEPGAAAQLLTLATLDARRTDEIAEHILGDLALSLDMLRQVNSAQTRNPQTAGNGSVLTVRRCIALLGMDGIRRAATGLRAWPGPLSEAGASAMRRSIDRVHLAARVAERLRPAGYDGEVTRLVAVLQNLGRLLVHYHFQDEAAQIDQLMQAQRDEAMHDPAAGRALHDEAAAYAVLGVGLEAIAAAAAKEWGYADDVLHMMRRHPPHLPVRAPQDDNDMLRTVASAANDLADAATTCTAAALPAAIAAIAKRHATALGATAQDLVDALAEARQPHAADKAGA